MSHYKPYPAYKDSGVEWLGKVPEHWQQMPLKRLVRSIEQGWSPECESWPANTGEWGVLKVGCVNGGSFRPEENKALPVTLEPRPELAICKGDVLVSRANTRELVGSCVPVSQDYPNLLLCDKIYRLRAGELVTTEFLAALITVHGRRAVEVEATGASSSMLNISQSVILDLPVALPASTEQVQIIAATSRETARIDALIEKKTRFIELLREKRQALITHAVTKGLGPNVKMKDSGVEWLGEVPEHWGVKPLKLLVKEGSTISYGIVQPGEPLDEGVPFVQTTNMSSGDFEIESLQKTTPEIAAGFPRSRLTGGEVILGIRASIGAAFVVPMHLAGVNLSRGVARIDCSSELSSHFFVAYLSSMAVDGYWQLAKQGSTFNEVSIATVKELLVPVPPREEQAEIEDMLSNATARLNSILKKTERSIDLLKERRSALITAAVTGQIDLRETV
ncbi:restriction endonuclease subunit S [Pseudomonas aeruginosa]|uniref:restriction endonuclease subunit S n=1 Tax=Pseudomonas aeruginosa TaxID=287 RepID=UPI000452CB98|nr:restriction endonuclease subunit S [Pseudomonas aeruginosa]EZO89515.1 hypothetical protein V555_05151 [Pseudomonas aeruginosa BWH054]HCE6120969.1 restriction endonuclease subunit S [Pseudomonas aeruginosa]